jgi:hypothetical protein
MDTDNAIEMIRRGKAPATPQWKRVRQVAASKGQAQNDHSAPLCIAYGGRPVRTSVMPKSLHAFGRA